MNAPPQHRVSEDVLTAFFESGDAMRSRSVSNVLISGTIDIPEPPTRLRADWQREIASRMVLEVGDVEAMPLARARARWPDYQRCVQAVSDWACAQGLPATLLAPSDVALMACRGARYHHDGAQYSHVAFCNLFLSDDLGLDLHFPSIGHRLPLTRGTVVIFDTGQPHGVIRRGSGGFNATDFTRDQDWIQTFLTWELAIEEPLLSRALKIAFDVAPALASRAESNSDAEQICLNGEPAVVCPDSGRWCPS
ncbi:MAG: hypothetical protein ACRYG5_16025 [Janthinobacterium lividum]